MAKANIRRPHRFSQPEIVPTTLAGASSGADGQLVAVNDVDGRPLWVRKGGVLVPAIDAANESYTNGVIEMRVNYSTGTSPPDGTIVHNQDEYDALGYDLKYPQDALNICPPIIKYPVVVTLEAGTHYGKPDNAGFTGYSVFLAGGRLARVAEQLFYYDYLLPLNADYGTICFIGDGQTTLEATQAGTTTTTTVTRSSGTWTVNQHRNNFVLIKTGAAAGEIYPIASNTTTVLTIAGAFSTTGAVTFEIVEPASVWLDYDNASGDDSLEGRVFTNCIFCFQNIRFGNVAHPFSGMIVQQGTVFATECKFADTKPGYSAFGKYDLLYPYNSMAWFLRCSMKSDTYDRCENTGTTQLSQCVVVVSDAYSGVYAFKTHRLVLDQTAIVCAAVSGTPEVIRLFDAVLVLGADYGKPIVYGNNACIGLSVNKGGSPSIVHRYDLDIIDTLVAVKLREHLALTGLTGSNNTTGWDVGDGTLARVDAPANVAIVTNAINLDGTVHPYSDVGTAGDYMDGSKGSKFIRMA